VDTDTKKMELFCEPGKVWQLPHASE
jgi:hypothetical protein